MLAICFIYRTIDFGKSFPLRSRSCAKKPAHQPPLHRHQRADILKFLVLWSQALPDSSMLARAGFTQSCYGTLSPSHRDKRIQSKINKGKKPVLSFQSPLPVRSHRIDLIPPNIITMCDVWKDCQYGHFSEPDRPGYSLGFSYINI